MTPPATDARATRHCRSGAIRIVVAAAALAACVAAPAAGTTAPATSTASALVDCHVPGIRNGVLCGSLQRPLDPAHPERAQIAIRYVVVPAMARRKFGDPVFLLAGGPG